MHHLNHSIRASIISTEPAAYVSEALLLARRNRLDEEELCRAVAKIPNKGRKSADEGAPLLRGALIQTSTSQRSSALAFRAA